MSLNLGDPPSWILVLLIGLGILWALSNGILDPAFSVGDLTLPMEDLGSLLVVGALVLGGFYFLQDVLRKV
ncbi:hypothetical protein [Halorubrum luteum]